MAAEGGVKSSSSAAVQVVATLRQEILKGADGVFLGSEQELLARFGISRPTLRQVARVLESDELLLVRRGIYGGYFGRRPTLQWAGRAAAAYLRVRSTSASALLTAMNTATRDIVRLAAQANVRAQRESESPARAHTGAAAALRIC